MKNIVKKILKLLGVNPANLLTRILHKSIKAASKEQGLQGMVQELRKIIPDISQQYNTSQIEEGYHETKTRTQQAFQILLLKKAVLMLKKKELNVVDIGDSSGNHLIYIKEICKDISFRTISVNLDNKAIEKIKAKGMEAIRMRAENLDLGDQQIDLFTTFQMVEHLMNPSIFFRRLAKYGKSEYMLVTLPYRKVSSVGFWTYRKMIPCLQVNNANLEEHLKDMPSGTSAEDEHIFELSPIDWKLLMLFSGWRPVYDETYLQYPKRSILRATASIWREQDFEGFWGVILKRDLSFSDIYKDWDDH